MTDAERAALDRAIDLVGGMTALARALTDRGHTVKDHRVVYQWKQTGVPAKYCPDIEAITGVRCEELVSDVNWGVLRAANDEIRTADYTGPDRRKAGR